MKVLLTGSRGFVGRNILEAFAERYDILAPSSRELDLTDERSVRDFFTTQKVDAVIHGAVRPGHRNAVDTSRQLYINTRMFFNLARNADRFDRFILLGSGSSYDVRCNLARVGEDDFDRHVPVDEGGFSKYIISEYIAHTSGRMVDLRIFGVFGPYEDYAIRFISNAICKALFDLPITLRQNRLFDYLWIDDLMPVLEYCLHNRMNHTAYNVTPDQPVELLTIAEMIRERAGKEIPIVVGQPGMGLAYSGDNRRLREEIPNLAFTSLREAIDRLYRWYEERRDHIDREKLLVDK
jgi:GDP-L-fucose synthase